MNRAKLAAAAACLALAACSQKTPADKRLDERTVAVGIMALQWPKVVEANSEFVVKLAVRNAGGTPLPSQAATPDGALRVNAAYHWKTTGNQVVVWDGVLTPLAEDLAPGAEQALDAAVKAPPSPGMYILEFDLVQSTAFWFGGAGSQTAQLLVEVR